MTAPNHPTARARAGSKARSPALVAAKTEHLRTLKAFLDYQERYLNSDADEGISMRGIPYVNVGGPDEKEDPAGVDLWKAWDAARKHLSPLVGGDAQVDAIETAFCRKRSTGYSLD